jgi:hypothetical protein
MVSGLLGVVDFMADGVLQAAPVTVFRDLFNVDARG